jgi:acetyltransferase-like isoleucine patch superfamily enzyme
MSRHPQIPPELQADAWEVGRLVLAAEYRTTPEILKRCFFLILERFVKVSPRANFFASSSPILCRLYRRFGFNVLVKDACRTGQDTFSLIHGTVASVAAAVGLEQAAPRARAGHMVSCA